MNATERARRLLLVFIASVMVMLACNLQLGTPTEAPVGTTPTASSTLAAATDVFTPVPTQMATSTAVEIPTATQGPPPAITVSAVGGRLNVRRGPGPEYDIVAAFLDGQSSAATARNAEGNWLLINRPGSPTSLGWVIVTTKYTSVNGEIAALPLMTVAPPALAFIRNCTPHEMLVNPAGVILPDRSSSPDNQVQFFPGEYSVVDQTTESEVASVTVFEGRTIDVRKDSSGTTYTCP